MDTQTKNVVTIYLTAKERRKLILTMRAAGFDPKTVIEETSLRGKKPVTYSAQLG